ncbi:MAG: 3-oxoacyl-ACP synthase III family protein [Rhizobiaceae bacterium]
MDIGSIRYRLPTKRYSNNDVIALLPEYAPSLSAAEIDELSRRIELGYSLTGSKYRYWLDEGEFALDYAISACNEALEDAGIKASEVGAIIYVGVGRGFLEPATAAAVQKYIGATNATSFDILEACVSWVRGLEIAQSLLKTEQYDNVLLVNCEMGMRSFLAVGQELTPDNLHLYFSGLTVGEAATATVLLPSGQDFQFHFQTFPEGLGDCMIPLRNTDLFVRETLPEEAISERFFALSGPLVHTGLNGIEKVFQRARYADLAPPDLTLIHSVSEKASKAALKRIGLDWDRHFDIHASHGNTVSASLPLGIALAIEAGRLTDHGSDVLLIGAGAGVSVGLCRFTC